LIVSANQVLVPVAASLNERDPDRLKRVYSCNLELLLLVVAPLFALLAAWAPLLSEVWVGRLQPQFVFFVHILALAWALNTLSNPAYFLQLGTGRIFWNTAGHVWMGIANLALGLLLGSHFGAGGIIFGMTAALVTGSALVVISFHRDHGVPWVGFRSPVALTLLLGSAVMYLATDYAYGMLVTAPSLQRYAICLALPFVVLGPFLWFLYHRLLFQVRLLRALASNAQ
jgi:O-antigen/teichoic acid export membrane protein